MRPSGPTRITLSVFEREAQAIARLKYPHIVTLYRYGEADGLLYLAMEYIEGADLAEILAGYRADQALMPAARAGQIIRPICLALDYAHQQELSTGMSNPLTSCSTRRAALF